MNYSQGDSALNQALANSYQKTDPTRFCYTVPKNWKEITVPQAKINYVIATWSGERRGGNEQLIIDPTTYLRKHLKAAEALSRSVDQITIMAPNNPREPNKFTKFLNEVKDRAIVLRRENCGQSYGSWVDCYLHYRNQFDYYIFVEDDYLPLQKDFDYLLIQMFEASPNCGYLCSRVDKYPPTNYMGRPHAAISNGITSSKVLSTVVEKLGQISYGGASTKKHNYAATPQLEFSWSFLDAGFWLYDYSPYYSAPYHHVGKIQHYGSIQLPAFFIPNQKS